jgi:hypothetical protein
MELRLGNNHLETLPAHIDQLSGLRVSRGKLSATGLDLSNNRLCGIDAVATAWADSCDPGWRARQECSGAK